MLIHNKDDIEFVTEFPCFLGHHVYKKLFKRLQSLQKDRKLFNYFQILMLTQLQIIRSDKIVFCYHKVFLFINYILVPN